MTWYGTHPDGQTVGDGWYSRNLGGKEHLKILIGNPNV